MKITFLGTRGLIEARTQNHARHSALLIESAQGRIMIDCGLDWADELSCLNPDAILLTHAHADHAGGLAQGAPCPVWASADTWSVLEDLPISERRVIPPRVPFSLLDLTIEAWPVQHSPRAPAVAFKLKGTKGDLFYTPDVVGIPDQAQALNGVVLYIGDGASFHTPLTRVENGTRYGHALIAEQLRWCANQKVPRTLFTHCGEEIVAGDENMLAQELHVLAKKHGLEAGLACDGMKLIFV